MGERPLTRPTRFIGALLQRPKASGIAVVRSSFARLPVVTRGTTPRSVQAPSHRVDIHESPISLSHELKRDARGHPMPLAVIAATKELGRVDSTAVNPQEPIVATDAPPV